MIFYAALNYDQFRVLLQDSIQELDSVLQIGIPSIPPTRESSDSFSFELLVQFPDDAKRAGKVFL